MLLVFVALAHVKISATDQNSIALEDVVPLEDSGGRLADRSVLESHCTDPHDTILRELAHLDLRTPSQCDEQILECQQVLAGAGKKFPSHSGIDRKQSKLLKGCTKLSRWPGRPSIDTMQNTMLGKPEYFEALPPDHPDVQALKKEQEEEESKHMNKETPEDRQFSRRKSIIPEQMGTPGGKLQTEDSKRKFQNDPPADLNIREGLECLKGQIDPKVDAKLRDKIWAEDPLIERDPEIRKKFERTKDKRSTAINRFKIKPGSRWDGVMRGNGFERGLMDQYSAAKVAKEQEYDSAEDEDMTALHNQAMEKYEKR